MLYLSIFLCMCFLGIFYFDFTTRYVYLWLYIIAAITSVFLSLHILSFQDFLFQWLFNLGILSTQWGIVYLYFSFKQKKFVNPLTLIGTGDVLIFIILTFLFPPLLFILFIIGALSISLLVHAICLQFIQSYDKTVPLAGYVSLCAIPVILFFEETRYCIYSHL